MTQPPFRIGTAGPGNYAKQQKAKHPMSERLETLKKARERMTDDRDAFAKVLAAPFDRDKAERARIKFIETQSLIDAIDRAIDGEQVQPAAGVA
jgi:acyl-CoA reductase-like NAD-dependent aldehyde dehydrogenase